MARSSCSVVLGMCGLFLTASAAQSPAQESLSVREILAIAKIAGACGILNSQIHFQESTKLDGGELFVTRFWTTEAARLGKTVQEHSAHCDQAITAYDKMWQAARD